MTAAGTRRNLGDELRANRAPLLVAAVGTAVGLVLGAATGRAGWPVYAAVLLTGGIAVTLVHLKVGFSRLTICGLVVFALGHLAGGMVPVGEGVLYQQWLVGRVVRYDNVQHAWGFGFAGRAVWEAMRAQLRAASAPRVVAVVVIVLGGMGLGAANEVFEYGLTKVLAETNVGGYENTARDLVANLVGATTAAAVTARAVGQPGRRSQSRSSPS